MVDVLAEDCEESHDDTLKQKYKHDKYPSSQKEGGQKDVLLRRANHKKDSSVFLLTY